MLNVRYTTCTTLDPGQLDTQLLLYNTMYSIHAQTNMHGTKPKVSIPVLVLASLLCQQYLVLLGRVPIPLRTGRLPVFPQHRHWVALFVLQILLHIDEGVEEGWGELGSLEVSQTNAICV